MMQWWSPSAWQLKSNYRYYWEPRIYFYRDKAEVYPSDEWFSADKVNK